MSPSGDAPPAEDVQVATPAKSTSVARFLALLHPRGGVYEIRIPNCPDQKGRQFKATASGYFDDHKRAQQWIQSRDSRSEPSGIYATLNPVRPSLLARSANELAWRASFATSGGDIVSRCNLLIDIDSIRDSGISATHDEVKCALVLAKAARTWLSGRGFPDPLRGMSGNGAYLIYRIEIANDERSTNLISSFLRSLAKRFDTSGAHVDTSTFDPNRICKVLGTWARKGSNLIGNDKYEDRPHRQSYFIDPGEDLQVVDAALIQAVVDEGNPSDAALNAGLSAISTPAARNNTSTAENIKSEGNAPRAKVERCRSYLAKIESAIDGQKGSNPTLQAAASGARFGLPKEQFLPLLEEYNARCQPPWSPRELQHKLDDGYEKAISDGEWNTKGNTSASVPGEASEDVPPPAENAAETLGSLLDRLRRGEGDVLYKAGECFEGFEWGPKKITVLGAPPGCGKTAATTQMTMAALKDQPGLQVYIANAEMPFEVLLKRELSRRSGVPARAIRFAELTSGQLAKVEAAAEELMPLVQRIGVMSPPFTIDRLLQECEGREPGLLVVDYLQKFAAAESDPRQGVNLVVSGLRTLALQGWGVMALSATTRGRTKSGSSHDGGSLTMASFKESGEIEFNADSAYLIRDEGPVEDGNEAVRNVVFDCVKNRHGEKHKLELVFDMPQMEFRSREPQLHDFGEHGDNPFSHRKDDQLFEKYDNVGSHL